MALLKISLLVFAAFVHVLPSAVHKFPKRWTTRKFNNEQDGFENCFCYPESQLPTIEHLLDPDNEGVERLVIYLYKNVNTNEIKMYTPQAEKQVLIPDLPYDAGDGLITISTEHVYSLLYSNPYKIKVYNDYIETLVPTVSDSLPIGLNTGVIEHITPAENYLSPIDNHKDNEYHFPKDIPIINVPSEESSNTSPGPFYEDFINPEQEGTVYNYPFTISSNPLNIPLNPQVFSDSTQTSPHVIVAVPLNPGVSPYNFPSEATNSQFSELDFNINQVNLNDVYTFGTDQDSSHHHSFNTWFYTQLQRFKKIYHPTDIKATASHILKGLVLKILKTYNISISTDGYIRDTKGEAMDPLNLELRPIFLGEKLVFQIYENKRTVIKLPKDHQFLEGVLVTLVSPPQILGIIPLSKSYLSPIVEVADVNNHLNANTASAVPYFTVKENIGPISGFSFSDSTVVPSAGNSYSETHSISLPSIGYQIPQHSESEVTYWSSGPYHTVSNMPYPTANWDHSELNSPFDQRRKQSDTKIQHFYEPPTKRRNKEFKNLAREEGWVSEELPTAEPEFLTSSFPGEMKTLLDQLMVEQNREDLNSTDDVNILKESEDKNGEAPGFRIIGGSAATGSGTPLSNKGRSGFTENA